jgi:large subunit ribosomal protein L21
MFAVIKTGGKQYKVSPNDVIKIEKVSGDVGSLFTFSDILMLDGQTGVKNASVTGEILSQGKDKKVIIFKKKRRQNYRRKKGHRQEITVVRIKDILSK